VIGIESGHDGRSHHSTAVGRTSWLATRCGRGSFRRLILRRAKPSRGTENQHREECCDCVFHTMRFLQLEQLAPIFYYTHTDTACVKVPFGIATRFVKEM
jgi:hypothetical protein